MLSARGFKAKAIKEVYLPVYNPDCLGADVITASNNDATGLWQESCR
jgi:hypothetical protein